MTRRTTILLALALAAAGCGTTAANTAIVPAPGAKPVFEIPNSSFDSEVKLESAKSFYVDDILQVIVNLRSQESETVRFEHKEEWYDADGVKITDSTASWEPDLIDAGASKQLTCVAPAPGAARCLVMIRRPLGDS